MVSWLSRALGLSNAEQQIDGLEPRLALAVGADITTAAAAGGVLTVAGTLHNDGPNAVTVSYLSVSLSRDRYAGDLDDRHLGTIVLNTTIPAGGSASFADTYSVRRETLSPAYVVVEARRRRSESEITTMLGGTSGFWGALFGFQYSTQLITVGSSPAQVVLDAPGITDADRGFSVRISGPGQVGFIADGGAFDVAITGTTPDSAVQIRPVGNSAHLGDIHVFGPVRSLNVEKVPFSGHLTVDGSVREIKLGAAAGAHLDLGEGQGVSIKAGAFTNGSVVSRATIASIQTGDWSCAPGPDAGVLSAPTIGSLSVKGAFGARLDVAGRALAKFGVKSVDVSGAVDAWGAWRISGNVESIKAGSVSAASSIAITGDLKKLQVGGPLSGVIAAGNIKEVQVKGPVVGARLLAGANLGADGRLGGAGDAADLFGAGLLESFKADQGVWMSVIAAGLDHVDGVYLNGNDVFASTLGAIRKIEVRKDVVGSVFAAPNLPGRAKINNRPLNTTGDERFVRAV